MAMSKDDLLIKIEFEASEAKKAIEDLTGKVNELSSAQKSLDNQQKTLRASNLTGAESFGKVTAAVAGLAAAYYAVAKPLMASVKEFQNAYDANKKLGDIIARNGEVVATSLADLTEYASAISESGKASDDTVISLLSQAKAIGLNNDEAKRLVSASLDLSAVTGDDLNTAFRALLMTYKGVARGLGEQSVLVESLTETQLRAGKAVELIGQKYAGASNEGLKTFEGQSKRLTVALEELQQAIGGVASEMVGAQGPTTRFGDLIVNLTKKIKDNSETIITLGQTVLSTLVKISATLSKWALEIGKFILIPVDYVFKFIAAWEMLANKVNSSTGTMFKSISSFFSGIRGFLGDTARDLGKVPEAFDESLFKAPEIKEPAPVSGGPLRGAPKVSDEDLNSLEELKKKYVEVQKASEAMGKSEIEQARLKAVADLNEIGALEEKITKAGLMGVKAREISGNIRTAIVAGFGAAKEAALVKTLEDIEKQNKQIAAQNETFGMNTTERLNKELDLQLELIEAQRQKLILEGKYSEAIEASLAKQNELLKKRTEQRIGSESSPTEKAVKSLGDMGSSLKTMFGSAFSDSISSLSGVLGDAFKGVGSNISGYISSALGDSLGGVVSGIGDVAGQFASSTMTMISSVATLIMQMPAIIGAASDMLKGLLKFPAELLSSLSELFSLVFKVLTVSFVKTLAELPGKILTMITGFIPKLADALIPIIAELPNIFIKFLDSFPAMVEKLVFALASNAPRIIKSLIDALIKKGPALFAALARYAPKIAFAIAKGIWDALYGLITGNMPELEISIDTKALSDTFKKLGQSLTGDASRIFAVSNLTDQQTGPAEKLKALADNVNKGFRDGASWLGKVWQHWIDVLVSSWRGIIAGLVNLWHGVIDFLNGVISAFKDMFSGVGALLMGVVMGFREMWLGIYNSILVPFLNGINSAFSWVLNNVVMPLINGLTSAGAALKSTLEPLIGFGKKIVDGLMESLNGVMPKIFDAFYSIGQNMVKGLVDSLGQIGGIIGKAIDKLPSINVSMPSFKGHAEGGIIPGNANVFGDSPRNDVVPAMLSPGEAVIPRSAMQDPAIAETIRGILSNRSLPSFADGLMPRLASSGGNTEINLGGVVVNTSQAVDADFVKSRLMPTIRSELRRASLDGQTVIYKTGVR